MWYFDNLMAYKGSAHGDITFVNKGHEAMDKSFETIKEKAKKLRSMGVIEGKDQKNLAEKLWLNGEYTDYNRDNN